MLEWGEEIYELRTESIIEHEEKKRHDALVHQSDTAVKTDGRTADSQRDQNRIS